MFFLLIEFLKIEYKLFVISGSRQTKRMLLLTHQKDKQTSEEIINIFFYLTF